MINIQIRAFRDKLVKVINEEQLPTEIKRLVLAEVFSAVTAAADGDIAKEQMEGADDDKHLTRNDTDSDNQG